MFLDDFDDVDDVKLLMVDAWLFVLKFYKRYYLIRSVLVLSYTVTSLG